MKETLEYDSLTELAKFLKGKLENKRYILLYGYNGVGKTRLSYEFKSLNQEKNENDETISADTLYYNAFTEDLFFWDNDIYNDTNRVLMFNKKSKFFSDFNTLNIDTKAREILYNFADFDFTMNFNEKQDIIIENNLKESNNIEDSKQHESNNNEKVYKQNILSNAEIGVDDNLGYNVYDYGFISFYRSVNGEKTENIKISRSEESLFILCFFLAIVDIVLKQNNEQSKSYEWVKYIYIDDPVSSLDDNNIIALAVYIAHLFKPDEDNTETKEDIKTIPVIISTHHALFHNVMWNEFKKIKGNKYFLSYKQDDDKIKYILEDIKDVPFFYHVAMINKLLEANKGGQLYTYHFAILRSILEKTASFFGYTDFKECLKIDKDKQSDNILNDEIYYNRAIQALNHGGHSLFEPVEMTSDTKDVFSAALTLFLDNFKFNIDKEIIEKEVDNGK